MLSNTFQNGAFIELYNGQSKKIYIIEKYR